MYANVEIKKANSEVTITIRSGKSVVFKAVILVFFVPILVLPILLCVLLLNGEFKPKIETFFLLAVAVFLIIFVYKHLKQAFGKEVLIMTNDKLAYKRTFLGIGKYFEIRSSKIKKFKYIGYDQQAKHPLEIKGDVLGFGTQQSEIAYLNQVGTMVLETEYEILKFGVDVDEEDYQKIKQVIETTNR